MGYIEESLSKAEKIEAIFKMHWFARVPMWTCFFFAPFTLGVMLIPAIWLWLKLRYTEQGVTNKRVILKTGIISRHTEEMKIGSVETVEIRQSVMERMCGCGTVKVTGRGVSDVVFNNIDDPLEVKRQIESVDVEREHSPEP